MRAFGPSTAFDARPLVLMQLQDKMPLLNGEIAAEEFLFDGDAARLSDLGAARAR